MACKTKCPVFFTTLLVSLYQYRNLLKQVTELITKKYSIGFIYKNFRNDFYNSKNIARERKYYIQNYCGCYA
ncbi:hypothetical protein B9J78_03090 [bacterium Unc6]|nr:hypothetical protein [bacterium Unc6]